MKRKIHIGFVDLGADSHPITGKSYPVISATDGKMENLPIPAGQSGGYTLHIRTISFYVHNLPEFDPRNEVLISFSTQTLHKERPAEATEVVYSLRTEVKNRHYAPSLISRPVFEHIGLTDGITLGIELLELDRYGVQRYEQIFDIAGELTGNKGLDILRRIPYLTLVTILFRVLANVLAKNPDDHIWSEKPVFKIHPGNGEFFLRSGYYLFFETQVRKKQRVTFTDICFRDGGLVSTTPPLPNHLILGMTATGPGPLEG